MFGYVYKYYVHFICIYIYIFIRICIIYFVYIHSYRAHVKHIYGCGSNPVLSRGPLPPSLTSQIRCCGFLAAMIEHVSALPSGGCRGAVCRNTPPSVTVTRLCREMAAQASYKPYVFDSLPHIHMSLYRTHGTCSYCSCKTRNRRQHYRQSFGLLFLWSATSA